MSGISPLLSLAKQRQRQLGAKPVLWCVHAYKPTQAGRAIHPLHPDRAYALKILVGRAGPPSPVSSPRYRHDVRLDALVTFGAGGNHYFHEITRYSGAGPVEL
jgi:hypothetical protein